MVWVVTDFMNGSVEWEGKKLPKPCDTDARVFQRLNVQSKITPICIYFSVQLMGDGEILRLF